MHGLKSQTCNNCVNLLPWSEGVKIIIYLHISNVRVAIEINQDIEAKVQKYYIWICLQYGKDLQRHIRSLQLLLLDRLYTSIMHFLLFTYCYNISLHFIWDNHVSTSSLNFYGPDAFPSTQPTMSNLWSHNLKRPTTVKTIVGGWVLYFLQHGIYAHFTTRHVLELLWAILSLSLLFQPCEFPPPVDGSHMKCALPLFLIPKSIEQIKYFFEREWNLTDGPGVASFVAKDGRRRFDVYAGLQFDGYRYYENISREYPEIKFNFLAPPTLSCPSDVIEVRPDKNTIISIEVCDNNDTSNKSQCNLRRAASPPLK